MFAGSYNSSDNNEHCVANNLKLKNINQLEN